MKKKFIILFGFYAIMLNAQPLINSITPLSTSVGRYAKFEVDLDILDQSNSNSQYKDPSDPSVIKVWAVFHSPSSKNYTVNAFFFQDYNRTTPDVSTLPSYDTGPGQLFYQYCQDPTNNAAMVSKFGTGHPYEKLTKTNPPHWKIRFSPTEIGTYSYEIHASDPLGSAGPSATYNFICTSSSDKGFIRLGNKHYLKYDNNDTYFPIGSMNGEYSSVKYFITASPPDVHSPEEYGTVETETYIDRLSAKNANHIRIPLWSESLNVFGYDFGLNMSFYKNSLWDDPTDAPGLEDSYGINLKDAWQLDYIVDYCKLHGINIQLILNNTDLVVHKGGGNWNFSPFCNTATDEQLNPLPNVMSTGTSPYQFFADPTIRQVQKNMLNYIVSRWGYATNIVSWELMNEMNHVYQGNQPYYPDGTPYLDPNFDQHIDYDILAWTQDMYTYLKSIDVNSHLVTLDYGAGNCPSNISTPDPQDYTGFGSFQAANPQRKLVDEIAKVVDYTDNHTYQYPAGSEPVPMYCNWPGADLQFIWTQRYQAYKKPYSVSEWGSLNPDGWAADDPRGFYFHDVSWASGFSGMMGVPVLCWTEAYILKPGINAETNFYGLQQYWNGVKLDQDDNLYYYTSNMSMSTNWCLSNPTPYNIGCTSTPNPPPYTSPGASLKYQYFIKNKKEVYGWAIDPNFTIEAILSNPSTSSYATNAFGTRPTPLSSPSIQISNLIPGDYSVTWYNTTTGAMYGSEVFNTTTGVLNIMGSSILAAKIADGSNIFGDIAFKIVLDCHTQDCGWNEDPMNFIANPASLTTGMASSPDKSSFYYVDNTGKLIQMYMNNTWQFTVVPTPTTVLASSGLVTDNSGRIYYVGVDRKVYVATYNIMSNSWSSTMISGAFQTATSSAAKLALDPTGNVYFAALPARLVQIPVSGTGFGSPAYIVATNVKAGTDIQFNNFYPTNKQEVYFVGSSDSKLYAATNTGSGWTTKVISSVAVKFSSTGNIGSQFVVDNIGNRLFYIGSDNKIYNTLNYDLVNNLWSDGCLNTGMTLDAGLGLVYADGDHVFYVGIASTNAYGNQYNVYNLVWNGSNWDCGPINTCRVSQASTTSEMMYYGSTAIPDKLYYIGADNIARGAYWVGGTCPTSRMISPQAQHTNKAGSADFYSMNAYPNPSNGELTIHLEIIDDLGEPTIVITNIVGEKVKSLNLDPISHGAADMSLHLADLKKGIYFITLTNKNQQLITRKVILQ